MDSTCLVTVTDGRSRKVALIVKGEELAGARARGRGAGPKEREVVRRVDVEHEASRCDHPHAEPGRAGRCEMRAVAADTEERRQPVGRAEKERIRPVFVAIGHDDQLRGWLARGDDGDDVLRPRERQIGREDERGRATVAQRGRETQPFKLDVRKLKALGLTVSLETGYRLSPRGQAWLGGER